MAMTNRERMLAILDGKSPDRIPWLPRIKNWYLARKAEGNLPPRFAGMSEVEVGFALGMGHPGRGGKVFTTRYEGLEVIIESEPPVKRTSFVTPYGTVVIGQKIFGFGPGQVDTSGITLDHPIKTREDYRVWEYVAEHTYYDPCYEEYLAFEAKVGDDGYPLVNTGDCPFHNIQLNLVGYNEVFYHMADYLNEFEHLITVMTQVEKERLWPVVANSPARLIAHGSHFDSQMTPPKLFRKYITPYYQELSALLHARGKTLSWHADDDSHAILAEIKEAGFDMSECFCTAPMARVTLDEARTAWGTDVIIWGGVPSVILEPAFPDEEFEEYMRGVFRAVAPGDAFILGVADNIMPGALLRRLERIAEMVEEYGRYPVQVQ